MTTTKPRSVLPDLEEARISGRLIGEAFRSPLVMSSLLDAGVTAADFTSPMLLPLWTVCVDQHRHGKINPVLVEDALTDLLRLKHGDEAPRLAKEAIDFCQRQPPIRAGAELPQLVEHMRRRVTARKVAAVAEDLNRRALEPKADPLALLDEVKGRLDALAAGASATRSASGSELALLGQRRLNEGAPLFEHVPLGLPNVDDMLGGGAVVGRVTVICAGTGVGKSTYATHVQLNALKSGHGVLCFTFEAERDEVSDMLVEMHSGFRYPRANEKPTREQGAALAASLAWLSEQNIHVEDASGLTVEEVRARVIAHKHLYGIDTVIVDYVQDVEQSPHLMGAGNLAYVHISKSLRKLAKDERVAVIELSQVSELQKDQKKLDANNTALTKQFGRDAAAVVIVERDQRQETEKRRNVSHATLVKNRFLGGRLGEDIMFYDRTTGRLTPCDDDGDPIVTVEVKGWSPNWGVDAAEEWGDA